MRSKGIARSASPRAWTTTSQSRRSTRISRLRSRAPWRRSKPALQKARDRSGELLVVAFVVVELRRHAQQPFRRRRPRHDRYFDLVLEEERVLKRIGIERGRRERAAVRQRKCGH